MDRAEKEKVLEAMEAPAAELDLSTELGETTAAEALLESTGALEATAPAAEVAADAEEDLAVVTPAMSSEERHALLAQPFVEALMETTMEETLFNLMAEAIDDEFNLLVLPRQIVQNALVESLPAAAAAAVDDSP